MVWERLQRANPAWIVLALLANFLIMICWTQQWRALLPGTRPVEWPRMLSIVGITAVARGLRTRYCRGGVIRGARGVRQSKTIFSAVRIGTGIAAKCTPIGGSRGVLSGSEIL